MTKSEALSDINGTIEQIREYCRNVDDGLDASYVANNIEMWLSQLRCDIEIYDDAEDDENNEE